MDNVLWILLFLVILLFIEIGYYAFQSIRNPEKREVQKRLKILSSIDYQEAGTDISKRKLLSNVSWLQHLLLRFPITDKFALILDQSGVRWNVGLLLLFSLSLAAIGFLLGTYITKQYQMIYYTLLLSLSFTFLFGLFPLFYILLKKKQRMGKFNAQLPEALDLIARSLKAGHAFSAGLKTVADEMLDPIGTEFYRTLNEINFGVSVTDALKNLAGRIDCPDLRIFTISVIIQRETGGNLAEILEKNGTLIRERFKFEGKIRTLAAPGKLSAIIISLLPFVLAFLLSYVNPNYLGHIISDPMGRNALFIALLLAVLGIVIMRKMVAIKV
jgi:tight adherence protein B